MMEYYTPPTQEKIIKSGGSINTNNTNASLQAEKSGDPEQQKKLNMLLNHGHDFCDIINNLLQNNDFIFFGEGHAYKNHIDNILEIMVNMCSNGVNHMVLEIPRKYQSMINQGDLSMITHRNYKKIAEYAHSLGMMIICADIDNEEDAIDDNPYKQNARDQSISDYIISQVPSGSKCFGLYGSAHITEKVNESASIGDDYTKSRPVDIKRFVVRLQEQGIKVGTIEMEVTDNMYQPSAINFDQDMKNTFGKKYPHGTYIEASKLLDPNKGYIYDYLFVENGANWR